MKGLKRYKYFRKLVTKDTNIREGLKTKIATGTRVFWALIMTSGKVWFRISDNVSVRRGKLRKLKMKMLMKIYGTVNKGGQRKILANKEFEELNGYRDIVTEIKSNRLRLLGYVGGGQKDVGNDSWMEWRGI